MCNVHYNTNSIRTAFVGKNTDIIEYWSVFFILKLLNALTIFEYWHQKYENTDIIEYWSVFFILKLLNALTIFLKHTEV